MCLSKRALNESGISEGVHPNLPLEILFIKRTNKALLDCNLLL